MTAAVADVVVVVVVEAFSVSASTLFGTAVRTLRGGECFQQRSVTGSKALKEDRICSIGNGFAIRRPEKPNIHPRFVAWHP